MLTLEDGKKLIKIARKELDNYFKNQEVERWDISDKKLEKRLGVFVSLHTFPDKKLRGCIGFPVAQMPLWESVREAVKSSAFEDPRFLPLTKEELNEIIIEISVLTESKLIKQKNPEGILSEIEIGRDGLILEYSGFSGLLLPQVPVENKWDTEYFLQQLCLKAGVSPKSWKNKSCRIYKFQAQIFSEKSPNEEALEIKLK
jgi:hypothetical protein